jgi:hypothetical protein
MAELILIGVTALAGYLFSNQSKLEVQKEEEGVFPRLTQNDKFKTVSQNEKPSGSNIYTSNRVEEVNKQLQEYADRNYQDSKDPHLSSVIPPLFNNYGYSGNPNPVSDLNVTSIEAAKYQAISKLENVTGGIEKFTPVASRPMFDDMVKDPTTPTEDPNKPISLLTGLPLEISHNNMVPFFGSNVKQNMETFANVSVLDHHTGNKDTFFRKKEQDFMGDITYQNPYPLSFTLGVSKERYSDNASRYKQGETPFDKKYIEAPIAGTIDNSIQLRDTFKSVDELRISSKPKQTFEGRTVSGKMGENRSVIGDVGKFRPDTFYEKGEDHLFRTPGANLAQKSDETFIVKDTYRQDQLEEYYGNKAVSQIGERIHSKLENLDNSNELMVSITSVPKRNQLDISQQQRNVTFDAKNPQFIPEYLVPSQERNDTERRSHTLNVSNVQKGLKPMLSDTLKTTNNESRVINNHIGYISTNIDQKGRKSVYDSGIVTLDPKSTQRESLPETQYKGVPLMNSPMVYTTYTENGQKTRTPTHVENYRGTAQTQVSAVSSREQYQAAQILDRKEIAVSGQRPSGPQQFQVAASKNVVHLQDPREGKLLTELEDRRQKLNPNLNQVIPTKQSIGLVQQDTNTILFLKEMENNRLEDLYTSQLKENPFYNLK